MAGKLHSRYFVLLVVLAIVAVAIVSLQPITAYADDDPPPPTPTEESLPPTEEPEAEPTQEAAETETAVEEDMGEGEGQEAEEAQEAEEVVEDPPPAAPQSTDPYFTYGGQTYRFSSVPGYCLSYPADWCIDGVANPFQLAINWLIGNDAAPDDSTVYVEDGVYSEDPVVDGTLWSTTPTQLNFQSLNGSGTTTIDGSLSIQNMFNVVLQGFTINDGLVASNNTGTLTVNDVVVDGSAGTGITISGQDGDVELDSVEANNNAGSGASIENTAGGDVTITDSTFNDNNTTAGSGQQAGLSVDSNGAVLLDGVQANGNLDGDGAVITANSATVLGGSFNNNTSPAAGYGNGLVVESGGGEILVSGVTASGNEESGAVLYFAGADPANLITVKFSRFNMNGEFGVWAMPESGTVMLECVCGYGNGLGKVMVPVGETVVASPCPPGESKGKEEYVGTLLSDEFPKTVNAGNGVLVTFPIIEILNPDEVAIGKVWALLEKNLPLPVGEGERFMAGVKVEIINAALIEELEDGLIKIEFYIAAYLQDREYTVYWFDEEAVEWVSIPYVFEEHDRFPGGKIVAEWDQTGIFILVMHELEVEE